MKKNFSLFEELEKNIQVIDNINDSIKITLGPTGKNGILSNQKGNLKIITTGSILLNALEFSSKSSNILLKLFQQSSVKTTTISGDGSTTTTIFACSLLKNCLRLLENGSNRILLSNGLKRLSYYFLEKILELSIPISTEIELEGLLKTTLGQKLNSDFFTILRKSISNLARDGLI